jgi:hypothetical protein
MTFGDGTMIYHPAGIVDLSSTIISVSQQLDQIAEEAHHLLAGSQDFFQGPLGLVQPGWRGGRGGSEHVQHRHRGGQRIYERVNLASIDARGQAASGPEEGGRGFGRPLSSCGVRSVGGQRC